MVVPGPIIVEGLPVEIDRMNADEVSEKLRAACAAGVVIVADMTSTTFIDSTGTRGVLRAHSHAKQLGCELRLAVTSEHLLRVWRILGADQILPIYPSVAAAAGDGLPGLDRKQEPARIHIDD